MKKKVALIIHGWPTPEFNRPIHKFLLNQNYQVIAPNLNEIKKEFKIRNIVEYLEGEIKSNKLDLIIGVSMGGLITPYVAQKYPKAKLVFLASGPYFKPRAFTFNLLTKAVNSPFGYILVSLIKAIPRKIISFLYKLMVQREKGENKAEYLKDVETNLDSAMILSYKQIKEVINFVKSTDTTKVLPKINNKSLVLAGKKDKLMPFELSRLLQRLLPNSELVVNNISHLNVFNETTKQDFIRFLRN